jgi:hypothetical protein
LFRDGTGDDDLAMPIRGEMLSRRRPKWRPLIDLVGDDLTEWFMWMYEAELEGVAETIHAYKHRCTRSYLFLTRTGDAYAYTTRDRYVPASPADELEALAQDWEGLRMPDDARVQLAAATARARMHEAAPGADGATAPISRGRRRRCRPARDGKNAV